MAEFYYQGFSTDGELEHGFLEANVEREVFEALSSKGITPFEITIQNGIISKRSFREKTRLFAAGGHLSLSEQSRIANLLATLFSAGMTPIEAFELLAKSAPSQRAKKAFQHIVRRVSAGESVGYAFRQEQDLFSKTFLSVIVVCSQANSYERELKSLAEFFAKRDVAVKKIRGAMVYPIVLISSAFLLICLMIFYLAPNLQPIFYSLERDPPPTISLLLSVNEFLNQHQFAVSLSLIFTLSLLLISKRSVRMKKLILKSAGKLPIYGQISKLSGQLRAVQTINLLLKAGVPLSQALENTSRIDDPSIEVRQALEAASQNVGQGKSAYSAFIDDSAVSVVFAEMFRIGEEANRLATTLDAIEAYLSSSIDEVSNKVLTLIGPIITLVLGTGIGAMVYSLVSAMLEVNKFAF